MHTYAIRQHATRRTVGLKQGARRRQNTRPLLESSSGGCPWRDGGRYRCLWGGKNAPCSMGALAMQSSGRNCYPAPDLVL